MIIKKLVIEEDSIIKGKTSSQIEITCKLHYDDVWRENCIRYYLGKKLIKEVPFREKLKRKQYIDYLLLSSLNTKRCF